jgi:hypothetical protein
VESPDDHGRTCSGNRESSPAGEVEDGKGIPIPHKKVGKRVMYSIYDVVSSLPVVKRWKEHGMSMSNQHPNQSDEPSQPGQELSEETKALLQLIDMGRKDYEEGNYQEADEFFEDEEIRKHPTGCFFHISHTPEVQAKV